MSNDMSPAAIPGTQASSAPSASLRMYRKDRGESTTERRLGFALTLQEAECLPQTPTPFPGLESLPRVQPGLGLSPTISSRHHVSSIYGVFFFFLLLRFSLDECPLSLDLQHPPAVGLMSL